MSRKRYPEGYTFEIGFFDNQIALEDIKQKFAPTSSQ